MSDAVSDNATARRSVAAVGDVADVRCWSGIPFHFLQAAQSAGFAGAPWRVKLAQLRWPRRRWALSRVLAGRRPAGYQYSEDFLRRAGAQVPRELWGTEVITFNQHFPPLAAVRAGGGELNHYLDATFATLSRGEGMELNLPTDVVAQAREAEQANLAGSRRVMAMARWTAESAVRDCGVDPAKVTTILPGANFTPEEGEPFSPPTRRAGRERDFVLGFVGMDWRRKGLPFLADVRDGLARRGWRVRVRVAGAAPPELATRAGVEFVGRIEKDRPGAGGFGAFLAGCDVGCLFSRGEALGISTLEFLRAGVPVAGFAHQGLADTLPPDAGFRFGSDAGIEEVTTVLSDYLDNEAQQGRFRAVAQRWAPLVTWERCVTEMQELWTTGDVQWPLRPWLGLPGHMIPP